MSNPRPDPLSDHAALATILADLECEDPRILAHGVTAADLRDVLLEHVAWREEQAKREALRAFASRIGNDAIGSSAVEPEQTVEQASDDLYAYVGRLEGRAARDALCAVLEHLSVPKEAMAPLRDIPVAALEATVLQVVDDHVAQLRRFAALHPATALAMMGQHLEAMAPEHRAMADKFFLGGLEAVTKP